MSTTDTSAPRRAYALDALRGFAILTMILSGRIPFGPLPEWMYHIQVPPPLHKFNPAIPGISWVDLVFPFFLFAMGAAFPFALSSRIAKGASVWKISGQILVRGILLIFFAVVIQHIRPHILAKTPETTTYLIALLNFLFLGLIFTRFPSGWGKNITYVLRGIGFSGIVTFLLLWTYPDGSGFSIKRFDIIILVLANVSILGSFIWYFTRDNLLLRLGIIGLLFAIRISGMDDGWIKSAAAHHPALILLHANFLKYLFIVIPGTIAGDIILNWMKGKTEVESTGNWGNIAWMNILIISFSLVLFQLIFLYNRQVLTGTIISVVYSLLMFLSMKRPGSSTEKMLLSLFQWGFFWLLLGLLLEPFEGGIKKDHSTMSYYFVTSGLSACMIIGFTVVINHFKQHRWIGFLIENGQNPMLSYAGGTNLLTPIVMLLGIDPLLSLFLTTPWLGVLKGIILTGLLAVMVSFATRKQVFWRT